MLVTVSGVAQNPDTYSINATTLTFSGAPPAGTGNICVRYLGIPASNVTTTAYRTVTDFTATAGQTTFSPPSYTVGYIDVYQNGVRLGAADYTATNGTTIVLAVGANLNDLITTESFYVSSVLNAIPAVAGGVGSTYLAADSVITSKIAAGAVGSTQIAAGAVGSTQIAAGAVGTTQLAAGSVGPANLTGAQSGSAPIYGCRAWVNFNGTGTVAIRASGNVSSITDNGTGDYTVNFTTAMQDANYGVSVSHQYQTNGVFSDTISSIRNVSSPLTTTSVRVQHYSTSGAYDAVTMCVSIFR